MVFLTVTLKSRDRIIRAMSKGRKRLLWVLGGLVCLTLVAIPVAARRPQRFSTTIQFLKGMKVASDSTELLEDSLYASRLTKLRTETFTTAISYKQLREKAAIELKPHSDYFETTFPSREPSVTYCTIHPGTEGPVYIEIAATLDGHGATVTVSEYSELDLLDNFSEWVQNLFNPNRSKQLRHRWRI